MNNKPPIHTKFYYGWVIVFVAALSVFFSGPGQTYSNSIFIDYYIEDFGFSRSTVSGLYSAATLVAGITLFTVGRMVDRFGQRVMMIGVGTGLALALFWNSAITGPVMMFVGFFLIRLLGQGSMTLVPNTLVPQWFIKKRGRALSVMAVGTFASSALFPPLNAWLIESFGWRSAWVILGVSILVLFIPVTVWLVRNQPKDVGALPDGTPHKKPGEEEISGEISEVSWTLKQAMQTRTFWFILFCVMVPALVNTAVTFHVVSIMDMKGLGVGIAATILTVMAVVGFPTTFLTGYLADRFSIHYILAITFFGHILSLVLLFFTSSTLLAFSFAVVWGAVNGFERIALNIVWPNYFGRTHLGSIKGLAQTVMVIGSALGPLPFGIFYDLFGGYQEAILAILIFPVTAVILALLSPKPDPLEYGATGEE
ncbi:MFS transporter [Salimicrobium jeotgali]|uniref:MFS transporter n=1 Tax=Salimicrobium jeotgali TaxID=1230341 RepID=UPI000C845D6F|nr:MFS transporter [Salimicrobium jeotgali]